MSFKLQVNQNGWFAESEVDVFEGIAVFGDPGDICLYHFIRDAELADRAAAGIDRVVGGTIVLFHVLRDRKIRGSAV